VAVQALSKQRELTERHGEEYMMPRQILKKTLSFFGVFALSLVFSLPTTAATPDGQTPANEGVCDGLMGGSPGLYGLCNAYCEAQDLDTFDKEPPRTKILENYRKKMKAGDPDMPCIQTPCPCWTNEELASFGDDGTAAACPGSSSKLQIIDNSPRLKFAEADTTASRERCRYIDINTAPPVIRSFSISSGDAAACFAAVSSACDTLLP
jgi:hypothetical protein